MDSQNSELGRQEKVYDKFRKNKTKLFGGVAAGLTIMGAGIIFIQNAASNVQANLENPTTPADTPRVINNAGEMPSSTAMAELSSPTQQNIAYISNAEVDQLLASAEIALGNEDYGTYINLKIQAAEKLLNQGALPQAFGTLDQALIFSPGNIDLINRIIAVLERMRTENSVYFYQATLDRFILERNRVQEQ